MLFMLADEAFSGAFYGWQWLLVRLFTAGNEASLDIHEAFLTLILN